MKGGLLNNMARKQASPWLIASFALLIVVLAGGFYMLSTENSQTGSIEEKEATGDCNIAPSVALSMFNEDGDKLGTAVTPTTTYVIQNGKYLGAKVLNTSTFGFGDKIEILASASNYLDTVVTVESLKCGSNSVIGYMAATDVSSFSIKNTDGTAVLSDTAVGGAVNQSSSATVMTFPIRMDSKNDESSGDLVIIIETNSSEVDSITMSGLGGAAGTDMPEYDDQFSGSSISEAFNVPAVKDGASVSGTFQLTPESGKTIGAVLTPVYVTALSKQSFVDDNGSFGYGVEDASGDSKYEDTFDYDITVKA